METRQVTQVKAYMLHLNPMPANFEKTNIVAISTDKQKLQEWYDGQKTEPYQDDNWHKVFAKGSPLEWYNPIEYSDYCGIQEVWTSLDEINTYVSQAQASFGLTAVPELIGL